MQLETKYLLATKGTCSDGYTDCRFGVCFINGAATGVTTAELAADIGDLFKSTPLREHMPANVLFIPQIPDLTEAVPADTVYRMFPQDPKPADLAHQVKLGFNTAEPGERFPVQITISGTNPQIVTINRIDSDAKGVQGSYRR